MLKSDEDIAQFLAADAIATLIRADMGGIVDFIRDESIVLDMLGQGSITEERLLRIYNGTLKYLVQVALDLNEDYSGPCDPEYTETRR